MFNQFTHFGNSFIHFGKKILLQTYKWITSNDNFSLVSNDGYILTTSKPDNISRLIISNDNFSLVSSDGYILTTRT